MCKKSQKEPKERPVVGARRGVPLCPASVFAGVARKTDKQSDISAEAMENSSKFTERSLNVYENKGSLLKTREPSWNVIGNKGCYAF